MLAGIGALLLGRLAGGPGPMCAPRLHGLGLLVAAFGVLLAEPLVSREVAYSFPLCLAIAATLMVQFAVRNVRVAGVALAAAGLVLNALVVIVNGAMPVSERAAVRAGLDVTALELDSDDRHEAMDGATRLPALADRVPVPIPGHREVDSVGDLALAAGVALFAFSAACSRRRVWGAESGIMAAWAPERC